MKIYLTRHGQTDWNLQHKIQGQIEVPLNATGLKQAAAVRDKLKDTRIDLIFSSPLGRAMDTAKIINEAHNVPIIPDKRIIEEYYGKLEGAPRDASNTLYQVQRRSFFKRYPGGESYLDVCARVYAFINEIREKYPDKTILVVAHGGMSRVFHSYFHDMENEEFVTYGLDNCEVAEYEI